MMLRLHDVLFLLGVWALSVTEAAAAQKNGFLNPAPLTSGMRAQSPSAAYQVGQVLDINWTTTYSSVDLLLWQQGVDSSYSRLFQRKTSGTNFLWTINVDTFDTNGFNTTTNVAKNVFGLVMYQTGNSDGSESFSSQYFSVNGADSAAASSAAPTTTYVSAMGATSTSAPQATASFPYGYVDSPGDNNNQLRLGLGLGLGLGIPLLAVVGCLAYTLGRRRSHRNPPPAQQRYPGGPGRGPVSSQVVPGIQQVQPAFVEHYGPQGGQQNQTQQHAFTEHYGPQPGQQIQHAPVQSQPQLQPIVTAKYQ